MIRICGLDEVGRGCFAGPLVAAAVVVRGRLEGLLENSPVPIRDSKTLTHSQRQRIAKYLVNKKVKVIYEEISVDLINDRGISWANKEVFHNLIKKIKATKYVVDGNLKFDLPDFKIESRVKADSKVPQVILASIMAKLKRDKRMRSLHKQFPHYNWNSNKGYGTKDHQDAILKHGSCPHHRNLWLQTWEETLKSRGDWTRTNDFCVPNAAL